MKSPKADTPEATRSSDEPVDDPTAEEAEDAADASEDEASTDQKAPRQRRSISLSVRSLIVAMVIIILTGATATFAWLYVDAHRQLDEQASVAATNARAEKMALDYAVNAATMNYKDLQAWRVKLTAGTSPELNDKLKEAAKSVEQLLVPLEWSSTAESLVAKVRSRSNGVITVDSFVSVQTKTVQSPEALQSTATYSVTIDTNNNWIITDVGGIGSVVGPK